MDEIAIASVDIRVWFVFIGREQKWANVDE
jgi:hypothetical protein